ncbi:MAG: hydrogenase 4 subunit B, partial [Methylococcaceae bacterium]
MTLILAYSAVLLSLASGLLSLMTNQRHALLELASGGVKQIRRDENCQGVIFDQLDEHRFPVFLRQTVFILLGVSGICAILAGLAVLISREVFTDQIGLGLPWLPWHVRFDSLSGLFFVIIGIAVGAVSLYGPGYVQGYQESRNPFAVLGLFTGLFVAGMLLVLLADDAFMFMIA